MNQASKYQQLEAELKPYQHMMGQAADTVLLEDVSNYPIFVVSQLAIDLGISLIEREEGGSLWSIHLSTLEEMAAKKVVQMERVPDFQAIYKDPREYFCLFVLSDLGAQFIFLPRED